jgi:hypothetical protein
MKLFIEGADREQATLFPDQLDDYVNKDNPVHVIDAFVDALNLASLALMSCRKQRVDSATTQP